MYTCFQYPLNGRLHVVYDTLCIILKIIGCIKMLGDADEKRREIKTIPENGKGR